MAYRQKEYNYNDKLTKDQNLLMDKLYKMRMSGMAEAFENQLMNPNSGLESFETRFSEIINHEWSGRENKKILILCKFVVIIVFFLSVCHNHSPLLVVILCAAALWDGIS